MAVRNRTQALTTNDVRVLRLLLARGVHTARELRATLARDRAGAAPALRRIESLAARGLVSVDRRPGGSFIDVTGEGARQLRRADEAAYGRFA